MFKKFLDLIGMSKKQNLDNNLEKVFGDFLSSASIDLPMATKMLKNGYIPNNNDYLAFRSIFSPDTDRFIYKAEERYSHQQLVEYFQTFLQAMQSGSKIKKNYTHTGEGILLYHSLAGEFIAMILKSGNEKEYAKVKNEELMLVINKYKNLCTVLQSQRFLKVTSALQEVFEPYIKQFENQVQSSPVNTKNKTRFGRLFS